MKTDVFKVISHSKFGKSVKIWDSSSPMALPIALKDKQSVILERGSTTPRLRLLSLDPKGSSPAVVQPRPSDSDHGYTFDLEDRSTIELKRLNSILPAYLQPAVIQSEGDTTGKNLAAFSGSGRGLTQFQLIPSTYVAYVRSKPVFAIQTSGNEFHIRPLLPGLRLKLKHQKSILGQIGSSWNLNALQLSECTLFRASRWWRFGFISDQALPGKIHLSFTNEPSKESKFFRNALIILALVFAIGTGFFLTWTPPQPVQQEVKEEPIVKFFVPPKKQVHQPELKHIEPPQPKPEPKPIEKQKAPPKPEPKTLKPPKMIKKVEVAPPVSKPQAAPKKQATQSQSTARIAALKDVLGGALKLTGKPTQLSIKAPSAPTGLLKADGNSAKPIEIKAQYSGKVESFEGIGGAVGNTSYGKQEGISSGTKGGSFVALNDSGMAVEKGLLPSEVGAVIHQHMAEIRYCHEAALLYQPNLSGRVVVQFSIDPTGKVERANVQTSSVENPNLEKCIISKLVTWKFPKPKGGIHVAVSYPFAFKVLDKD